MLGHGISESRCRKHSEIPISAIREKNKRLEELECTCRMCGLPFVGHRARVLSGLRCGDVVALNGSGEEEGQR